MTDPTLTSRQLADLGDRLRERRLKLRREIKGALEGSEDENVVGLRHRLEDSDDWAVADALSELDIAMASHDLRELAEVEAALRRVRDGGYGVCVGCGVTIPYARLAANPAALRCVSCQEVVEKRPPGASA